MKYKVLVSPGYGAGWVTWASSIGEQMKFMALYKPIIDYVEAGGEFPDLRCDDSDYDSNEVLKQFKRDWLEKFPDTDLPYPGGLHKIRVREVSGPFRYDECDGAESITEVYCDWIDPR